MATSIKWMGREVESPAARAVLTLLAIPTAIGCFILCLALLPILLMGGVGAAATRLLLSFRPPVLPFRHASPNRANLSRGPARIAATSNAEISAQLSPTPRNAFSTIFR